MDFGRQVGRENRAKRLQKWHQQNDEKMKGNKMAEKSQQEVPTPRDPWGPDPWGVSRLTHPWEGLCTLRNPYCYISLSRAFVSCGIRTDLLHS